MVSKVVSSSAHLHRPPLYGWSALVSQVTFTCMTTIVVTLAAFHAVRPNLIRSPKHMLAHCWEALDDEEMPSYPSLTTGRSRHVNRSICSTRKRRRTGLAPSSL